MPTPEIARTIQCNRHTPCRRTDTAGDTSTGFRDSGAGSCFAVPSITAQRVERRPGEPVESTGYRATGDKVTVTRPRVAIVGLGMAVAPHAQSYIDLRDRVEVAYAYSPSVERRRAFAERFSFPTAESLDHILSDESVDIVSLLTPPNTHLELVRRCAEAGKHVLLEKPLEINAERCLHLVEVCEKRNVTLGIVLQHRFRPAGLKLSGLLQSDAIGSMSQCLSLYSELAPAILL